MRRTLLEGSVPVDRIGKGTRGRRSGLAADCQAAAAAATAASSQQPADSRQQTADSSRQQPADSSQYLGRDEPSSSHIHPMEATSSATLVTVLTPHAAMQPCQPSC
jgi:hypothetical protein